MGAATRPSHAAASQRQLSSVPSYQGDACQGNFRSLHSLLTPEEFESMRKYDVTGVGLHLGTAEEFVRKTGLKLPAGHDESEVGSYAHS